MANPEQPFILPELHCERCGYRWNPRRSSRPKVCPRCKSVKWRIRPDERTFPPAQQKGIDQFSRFLAEADPERVRRILALIETEVKLAVR